MNIFDLIHAVRIIWSYHLVSQGLENANPDVVGNTGFQVEQRRQGVYRADPAVSGVLDILGRDPRSRLGFGNSRPLAFHVAELSSHLDSYVEQLEPSPVHGSNLMLAFAPDCCLF